MKKDYIFKRIILAFIAIVLFICITGCNESTDEKKEIIFDSSDLKLKVGEEFDLNSKFTDYIPDNLKYNMDYGYFSVTGSKITPTMTGDTTIEYYLKGEDWKQVVNVHLYEFDIKLTVPSEIEIGDSVKIDCKVDGDSTGLFYTSSNEEVAKINDGYIEGLTEGEIELKAKCGEKEATAKIRVVGAKITGINCSCEKLFEVGSKFNIEYTVLPIKVNQEVKFEYNTEYVSLNLEVEKPEFSCIKEGKTTIKVVCKNNENIYKEIEIEILKSEAPIFMKEEGYCEMLEVNFNDVKGLLSGLKITDNVDNDIEEKVKFDQTLIQSYGEKKITLSVTDDAGNTTTLERDINVVYKYNTQFIGHAGCTFAVPNTEEAFLYAAQVLKYTAMECDVQVTKDGIYVTNHDSYLLDKNGNKVIISETNYNDLKQIPITSGNYTGYICTLEKYLEICKTYNMEAIIEIKGSSPGLSDYSQDNVPALMNYIKAQGMWEKSTILCGIKKVVTAIRDKGYTDIPIQYLVNSCDSQEVLDFCIANKADLSTNVTYGGSNSDSWLKKYKNAGCKISVWTFSSLTKEGYNQVQTWINKGVDYVTCDCHDMTKLSLK